MPAPRLTVLLGACTLCLLPACGSDDEKSSSGGGSGAAKATALEITVSDGPKGKSKVDAPKTVKAGLVKVSVTNDGKKPHDAQIVGVDGDQTVEQVGKIVNSEGGPIPGFIHGSGGVGTVGPGDTGTATDVLEAGRYIVFDSDGGGAAELEVTGEAGDAELPSAAATVTANEYSFETEGLKPGKNEITFENAGKELHHVIAAPINKGVKFAEVEKFASSDEEPSGPPPIDFESTVGTTVLDGGKSQVTELELKAGRYAFLCFIQDRKGGPPHTAKGMLEEVKIG